MRISSHAFAANAPIPKRYTCDGENLSPPLTWEGAPAGTKSFALLCDDPDAPSGTWRHWAVFDIPADCAGFPEAFPRDGVDGMKQGINDSGETGYDGPCPPRRHGIHHYRFHILALSVDRVALPAGASCRSVESEARKHLLDEAVLTGTYERR